MHIAKPFSATTMIAVCLLVSAGTVFAAGSAERANLITSSGSQRIETRAVSGFTRVVLAGSGEVSLTAGQPYHVEIIAESNIMPYITTNVSGDSLVLGLKPNVNLRITNGIRYNVALPTLNGVQIAGSGNVVIRNGVQADRFTGVISGSGTVRGVVDVETLSATISGSGDIQLEGNARNVDAQLSGSGNFQCRTLTADSARVVISGSGDAWIFANRDLTGTISGSGTLHYHGAARPTVKVSGSGQVRPF